MTKIVFQWSKVTFSGLILEQIPHAVQGQRTTIQVIKPEGHGNMVLYGKVEVGNCGPFTVLSLDEMGDNGSVKAQPITNDRLN